MIGVKISELALETSPQTSDLIAIANPVTGLAKKIPISGISSLIIGADITPPIITECLVISATVVRVVFSEVVTFSNSNGCSITTPTNNPIISISGSGTTTINFTVTNEINPGTRVYFSYNPSSGNILDSSSNELITINNFEANNLLSSTVDGILIG